MKPYLAIVSVSVLLLVQAGVVLAADSATSAPAPGQTVAAGGGQSTVDPLAGMEFVLVKGGCYKMGSAAGEGTDDEQPAHEVCVSDFYLGKYEVTQAQWQRVMNDTPSHFKQCGPDCPVESVSWDDSQEFIKKVNAAGKKKYRLPTEAEWEYAARSGGKDEKFAGTSDPKSLGDFAWFRDNSGRATHKVGQKKANGLGLYDMTGNVDEWCQDWYDEAFYKVSLKNNPVSQNNGVEHSTRGGAWDVNAFRARAAHRSKFEAGWRENTIGFRLALPAN